MSSLLGTAPRGLTPAEYRDGILLPVGRVVTAMERRGMPVSVDRLREIESDMATQGAALAKDLADWCPRPDMNWNSWQQLSGWLHDDEAQGGLGLPPSPYCKKGEVPDGKLSTDDRALEWIAGHSEEHRAPITTLRLARQVARMGRYARDWLAAALPHGDGTVRLHPTFGLASDGDSRPGAKTGRFGVKNPALNQVPRQRTKDPAGMRSAFIAAPGKRLVVVDYSQLEVVILAHLLAGLRGDDDPLVRMVRDGDDIHGLGAKFIFGELGRDPAALAAVVERKADVRAAGRDPKTARNDFKGDKYLKLLRDITKTGIYGRNYRKGVKGFATSFFLPDGSPLGDERAELLVRGLDGFTPGVPWYHEYVADWIRRYHRISSPFGRWYPLEGSKSRRVGEFNRDWRIACNWAMQAGGQEIMALAIVLMETSPALRALGYELLMVVHDETVGQADEGRAEEATKLVEECMTTAVRLLVPLKAEGHHGATWADGKG